MSEDGITSEDMTFVAIEVKESEIPSWYQKLKEIHDMQHIAKEAIEDVCIEPTEEPGQYRAFITLNGKKLGEVKMIELEDSDE